MGDDLLFLINNDLNSALKAHDEIKVSTLRLLVNAIKNTQIDKRRELSKEEVLAVIHREAKQRRESIESFKKVVRNDLVAKEEAELTVLERYLPKPLTDEELSGVVRQIILETKASSISEMGKIMGIVTQKVAGRADGGRIAQIVKEQLQV